MKRIFILFLICISEIYAYKIPSGPRLREIVVEKYRDPVYGDSIIIGGTTGSQQALGGEVGRILCYEFNYVTPENDFKQEWIHPDNSTWNWSQADAWFTYMKKCKSYYGREIEILRMHCPIGPQCSPWARDDSRTPTELDTNMTQFLRAICQKYNDSTQIKYMDVVNETAVEGSWHKDKPGIPDWECPWYKIGLDTFQLPEGKLIIPKYITKAFQIANEYAPDIKLIYNHHEDPTNSSWTLIKKTISHLIDNLGLRVDGIGWQAHVDVGWEKNSNNLTALRNLIDWAHSKGLEFHITEASVWIKTGATPENFEKQAVTYRAILDILLEKRFTGKVGWNTWNIQDDFGWHIEWYPSLFNGADSNYSAKPAYYAIQSALLGQGIEEPIENISTLKLYNSPNPFSGKTTIFFDLPKRGFVSLKIYNLAGEEIKTLLSGNMEIGSYKIEWIPQEVPQGIYLVYLIQENLIAKQKLILVK
ncbi:MAG: endo-1,4-beta-xylanase [candidate division WOR-3 bacterium]